MELNHLRPQRLPNRFPEGTRLVIEGRAGRIDLQYLEFPDGRHIDLPAAPAKPAAAARMRRSDGAGRQSEMRKI